MKTVSKERYKPSLFMKIIICLMVIYFVFAVVSFPLRTVKYTVSSDKVTERFRIVQISDLHSDRYGKDMSTLISAIDKAEPDIVVLTGDIYEFSNSNENTRILLRSIGSRYKCFYVAGNHEFNMDNWVECKAEAESFGVSVMEGDTVSFGEVTISGAAMSADWGIDWAESLEKCAEQVSGYAVLLYHFPEDAAAHEYAEYYDRFDLVLSGHAHGGQWRIPFILNGLVSPGEGLFPKYAGGEYALDGGGRMIVSRGLKRDILPVARIFNNPELVIVDITPE